LEANAVYAPVMPNASRANASRVASAGTAILLIIAFKRVPLHSVIQLLELARMSAPNHNASCCIRKLAYPLANADFAQLMLNASQVPVSKEAYVVVAMPHIIAFKLALLHFVLSVLAFALFALRLNANLYHKGA
jgi:hypothetical protein